MVDEPVVEDDDAKEGATNKAEAHVVEQVAKANEQLAAIDEQVAEANEQMAASDKPMVGETGAEEKCG